MILFPTSVVLTTSKRELRGALTGACGVRAKGRWGDDRCDDINPVHVVPREQGSGHVIEPLVNQADERLIVLRR